jgi:Uma2 family endonuclease
MAMSEQVAELIALPEAIEYPDSDGEPMAESDFQRTPLIYAVEALRLHFQDEPDVYVSGNMLLYYVEGNPRISVAPDVFVVWGVDKHERSSYRLWEEGKGPDFVLEVTSRSTRGQDQRTKRNLYAELGVVEYFLYDPTGDYLEPALQGFRLHGNMYASIRGVEAADGTLTLRSTVLGLDLRLSDGVFRYVEPYTGRLLLSHGEEIEARQAAEQRAQTEAEARLALERRVAELEAQLQTLMDQNPKSSE